MLTSISGQNERWALVAAGQPAPATPVSHADWWGASGASPTGSAAGGVSGITTSPTSIGMDSALMAFIGRSGRAGSPAPADSQSGSVAQAASSVTTLQSSNASDRVALSNSDQLLNDLHSLISVPGGDAPDLANTSPGASDSAASGISGAVHIRPQIALAANNAAPAPAVPDVPPPLPPSAPAPQSSDITNAGTATASSNSDAQGGAASVTSGYDGLTAFMQQFAMAAYSSGYASGMESSATSSNTSINA